MDGIRVERMPSYFSCPFCDSRNVEAHEHISGEYVQCHCMDCGAIGPEADDVELAFAIWNVRKGRIKD